ncbi:hypothetical protein [Sorangium sp. So ce233]|uniref:hypothetical protein n=1 Tax=Sorangium sp. So ce233 TaxID=3133290 RepID=UPI003F5F3646
MKKIVPIDTDGAIVARMFGVPVRAWTPHMAEAPISVVPRDAAKKPCSGGAPHDHGGSEGAVRVVRGAAIHWQWQVRHNGLCLVREERVKAGDVLEVKSGLVHSMGDAGEREPLVTLHFYAGPIDHMIVYDINHQRTLMVDGSCGAWLPWDAPSLIRCMLPGIRSAGAFSEAARHDRASSSEAKASSHAAS